MVCFSQRRRMVGKVHWAHSKIIGSKSTCILRNSTCFVVVRANTIPHLQYFVLSPRLIICFSALIHKQTSHVERLLIGS